MEEKFSIVKNKLKRGDVIIMGWYGFPVEHYGIYDGKGIYENRMGKNVKYESVDYFFKRYNYWKVKYIFPAGTNEDAINQAIERAKSKVGVKYNLFSFNCEHFIDYVLGHPLKSESLGRIGNFSTGLLIGGIIVGLVIKYNKD